MAHTISGVGLIDSAGGEPAPSPRRTTRSGRQPAGHRSNRGPRRQALKKRTPNADYAYQFTTLAPRQNVRIAGLLFAATGFPSTTTHLTVALESDYAHPSTSTLAFYPALALGLKYQTDTRKHPRLPTPPHPKLVTLDRVLRAQRLADGTPETASPRLTAVPPPANCTHTHVASVKLGVCVLSRRTPPPF